MNVPDDLLYTEEHEWIRRDGGVATIGITDFAQESLGDITYVELPAVGSELKQGDTFGVVESVKSVSDLYAPCSGKVVEANESLDESPETVNSDAYSAWFLKVEVSELSEEKLLSAGQYRDLLENAG